MSEKHCTYDLLRAKIAELEDGYKKTNDRMRKDRDTYKNLSKDQAQCIEELRDFAMTRDIIIANGKKMIARRDERIELLETALSALTRSREWADKGEKNEQ